jgi:lipid kinase YegS
MQVHVIIHGKAAGRPEVREAVSAARDKGHTVQVHVTWEGGDSARFAQLGVHQGADVVVAGGGDGTINEVAFGLITASPGPSGPPSLGVIPLGTANDFARSAGIPLDPTAALDLVSRPAVSVDLGRIGDRMFVNVATGGFGTHVTVETAEELKKALGGAAYLLTGVTRYSSIRAATARFTGPELEWEGNFLVLAIGNGRQAGGGHLLCPQATVDDGLLDVRILPDVPKGEVGQAMASLMREGLDAVERRVVSARLSTLDIEAPEDIFINLDGEPISGRRFHVEAVSKALKLHLPEECPLLQSLQE